MITTLDKFDIESISEYLYGLMEHINKKSEGDIEMVLIVASNKDKKVNHLLPRGTEEQAARLLITSLDKLTQEYPAMGMRIEKVQL